MREDTCKHLSEEHRKKISEALTGRHLSEMTKQKISESLKGREAWNKGKRLSEEHKRRMSESLKGKTYSKERIARQVYSRKIGKENYTVIEHDLFWNGKELVNIDEIMEEMV